MPSPDEPWHTLGQLVQLSSPTAREVDWMLEELIQEPEDELVINLETCVAGHPGEMPHHSAHARCWNRTNAWTSS